MNVQYWFLIQIDFSNVNIVNVLMFFHIDQKLMILKTSFWQIALKGIISDPKFQTSLFSEPQMFVHIQRELH